MEPGSFSTGSYSTPSRNLFVKVTAQLGLNSRLAVSHNYGHGNNRREIGERDDPGFYGLSSSGAQNPETINATRLAWTTAFGARFSNQMLLARVDDRRTCLPIADFPGVSLSTDEAELFAGTPGMCQGLETGHTLWEITDNFGMAVGNHRLTFGTHGERIDLVDDVLDVPGGLWVFTSLDSLAQGTAASYLRDFSAAGDSRVAFRVNQIGVYAQDQWVPTPRLTATAGLRLDVPYVPTPPAFNLRAWNKLGINTSQTPSGNALWSPRLGVNYDPSGRGTTVLRGGVGFFAGPPAYVWFRNVYGTVGIRANPDRLRGRRCSSVHARPEEPTHRMCRAVAAGVSSRLLRSGLPISPHPQGGARYGSGSPLGCRGHGGSALHSPRELGRDGGCEPAGTGRYLGWRRRPGTLRHHRRLDRSSDTQPSHGCAEPSRPAAERQRRSLVLGHGPTREALLRTGPR